MNQKPIKVLIAKLGLDGHESGAKVIARRLADEGMEVVYTGLRQSPQMIVDSAMQEDVDVVGLSILSGAHMDLCRRTTALFKENDIQDIPIILGGIIPESDYEELKKMGICEIFGPGTSTATVADYIQELIGRDRCCGEEGNNN